MNIPFANVCDLGDRCQFYNTAYDAFAAVNWLPTKPEETTAKADQCVQSIDSKQEEPSQGIPHLATDITDKKSVYCP